MKLNNKYSTDPVTSKLCTSINGIPIVSMREMFSESKTTSIDFSSFDTSSVNDMSGMFCVYNYLELNTIKGNNFIEREEIHDCRLD